jgi:hypothetical protein
MKLFENAAHTLACGITIFLVAIVVASCDYTSTPVKASPAVAFPHAEQLMKEQILATKDQTVQLKRIADALETMAGKRN